MRHSFYTVATNTLVLGMLSFMLTACSEAVGPPVTEAESIKTIEGFFDALGEYINGSDMELIHEYTTDDFILYELGQKMDKQEFLQFVAGSTAMETDWKLSDFRVSTDLNSAHASLYNQGRFLIPTDSSNVIQNYHWLESAYMVRSGDKLKIKFYFSDNIRVDTQVAD